MEVVRPAPKDHINFTDDFQFRGGQQVIDLGDRPFQGVFHRHHPKIEIAVFDAAEDIDKLQTGDVGPFGDQLPGRDLDEIPHPPMVDTMARLADRAAPELLDEFAEFQFLQPQWLWLLVPLWLLVFLHARHAGNESMWQRTCDARLLAEMTAGQGYQRHVRLVSGLLGFLLSVGVVAIAAPSWSRAAGPAPAAARPMASRRSIWKDAAGALRESVGRCGLA